MSTTDHNNEIAKLIRDKTPQELQDKLEAVGLTTNGPKKVMGKRLLDHSAKASVLIQDEQQRAPRRRLGIHGETKVNHEGMDSND